MFGFRKIWEKMQGKKKKTEKVEVNKKWRKKKINVDKLFFFATSNLFHLF